MVHFSMDSRMVEGSVYGIFSLISHFTGPLRLEFLCSFKKKICVVPVKDINELRIIWPIKDYTQFYKSAVRCSIHCLQFFHESCQSTFYSTMIRRRWINWYITFILYVGVVLNLVLIVVLLKQLLSLFINSGLVLVQSMSPLSKDFISKDTHNFIVSLNRSIPNCIILTLSSLPFFMQQYYNI